MGQFLGGWRLEVGDPNPLGVHAGEHLADRSVFAAGIHCLDDDEHFVLVLGPQLLLEFGELRDESIQLFAALLLASVVAGRVVRVPLAQVNTGSGLDAVAIHAHLRVYLGIAKPPTIRGVRYVCR